MSKHVVPVRVYLIIFATLVILTGLTVEAARHDFGALNTPVALGIATTKALLVILYFMHVKYADKLTWVVVASGFIMLGFLLFITLADYLSRGWSLMS